MSERAKLRWRCRRGMKELDVVLLAYLERRYDQAPADEQQCFAALLDRQDPQLLSYLLGREAPTDATTAHVVDYLRNILNA
ncbi:MAG: succinate dehydrogenase assembly factor 2 [Gammaproteobacteria bacterium]|nr:succinate dehydrogenase assembly factor 2 [Gammaproteobacteria bacterium]MCP5423512.1 succinate dehydrogenase assembly factor 2 [Gammaproteobacteria bacterium]